MRIKAMQQVVESQSTRIAALAAEKEMAALGHQDESTGQGEYIQHCRDCLIEPLLDLSSGFVL